MRIVGPQIRRLTQIHLIHRIKIGGGPLERGCAWAHLQIPFGHEIATTKFNNPSIRASTDSSIAMSLRLLRCLRALCVAICDGMRWICVNPQ